MFQADLSMIDPNTYSRKVIRTENEGIVAFNQISGTEYKGPLKFIITLITLVLKKRPSKSSMGALLFLYHISILIATLLCWKYTCMI
jgi:hypothetical protein